MTQEATSPQPPPIPAWRERAGAVVDPALRELLDWAPRFDFGRHLVDFYRHVETKTPPEAHAYLGLIDRYYLLLVLCGRTDLVEHGSKGSRWLYERCREVERDPDDRLDLWSREHYKAVALDLPVATPGGWRNHGDLCVGDVIFGPDGAPSRVIALNPIVDNADCYEIEFDDGTRMKANSEHRWAVEKRSSRRVPGTFAKDGIGKRRYRETIIMDTREIAAHDHRQDNRLAIRVNDPLQLPEADLPVAPYVLGAWLGDGTCSNGTITCGDEIWSEIQRTDRLGENMTPALGSQRRTVYCLHTRLRTAGLLLNKHIPMAYLRASVEQRLALLQGLMDTDGHCNTRGTATFVNTDERLVEDFVELCNTLGLKPRQRQHEGTIKGERYTYWQVSFQAYKALPPFRLARKLERCKDGPRPAPRRYIVACRRIPSEPMRCIQVDREDGLYLAGPAMVTTHNSSIITFAGGLQEILRDPNITIGIFSFNNKEARKPLRQIKTECERNERLIQLYPDVLWEVPKSEAPKWSENDGLIMKRTENPKEPTLGAYGLVDGMPTGSHFRLRIYDDVVTRESVTTPEMVKKVTEARELSESLGAKGGDAREWNIGTRYHFGDTYGSYLDRNILIPRIYPATANGKLDGEPVFFTKREWALKKKKQPSQVAAQMLQNPLADKTQMFQGAWLRPVFCRPYTLNVYILVDPSKGSPNRRSDRTAMAVIGVDGAGNKYLLDGFCHRMKLSERWANLKMLHKKWSTAPGIMNVEVGYERYGKDSDVEHFEEKMRLEKYHFVITEVNWTKDHTLSKTDRIERLSPDFEGSAFFLPAVVHYEGTDMIWEWSEERSQIVYTELEGIPSEWRRMDQALQSARNIKPIIRRDEAKQVYDVAHHCMEELLRIPYTSHDDFADAMSRVYDLTPVAPQVVRAEMIEDPVYVDS